MSEKTVIQINGEKFSYDSYTATGIAEGFVEPDTDNENEILGAWQYLEITGIGYHLQGFFGRALRDLIHYGKILSRQDYATMVNNQSRKL